MKINLPRPWFFGLIGSLIILMSTVVSQYFVTRNQQQIEDSRQRLSELQREALLGDFAIHQTDMRGSLALIEYMMLEERSINRLSAEKAQDAVKGFSGALGQNLFSIATELLGTSGVDIRNDERQKQSEVLRDKILGGDARSVGEFLQHIGGLRLAAGKHQAALVLGAGKLGDEITVLETKNHRIVAGAFVLQVIGLLVLLFKERPESGIKP